MNNTLIAITTYNQAEYTEKCFDSLKHTQAKVICIDDASTDHTAEVCQKAGVEFICHSKPKGLTYSWNYAYRYFLENGYDFLIISNNDVLIPKGSMESVVESLKKYSYVGCMTRRNELGYQAKEFGVETYYSIDSKFVDDPKNYQKVQNQILKAPLDELPVSRIYGFCFGVSRKIKECEYSDGNLFDPQNINIGQEEDLESRTSNNVLCRKAFVFHYKGVSMGLSHLKGQDQRNQLFSYHPSYKIYLLPQRTKNLIVKCIRKTPIRAAIRWVKRKRGR